MSQPTINSKYALSLIDVVFGVVIAIPLLELPVIILQLIQEPSYQDVTRILLLVSSLLFCCFYWLEIHEYLAAQDRLNELLKIQVDHEITPKQSRVFLGGIVMITALAATLKYAELGAMREFLIANIIFWIFDMLGTREIKAHYKRYKYEILRFKKSHKEVYEWYDKRIISPYYWNYGLVNTLFFSGALVLFLFIFEKSNMFGICFGSILLIVTPM